VVWIIHYQLMHLGSRF